ncbi:MAG: segregation/condensation protein A [Candidatus Paceibacterota bacterium]
MSLKLNNNIYSVESENYTGPLDKLLELVEKQKMDINVISLSKVTGGFLEYLEKLEKELISHKVISDFLIIASKLILIKSKELIPVMDLDEEDEEDIKDLEIQLKVYKDIKGAFLELEKIWSIAPRSKSREFLMARNIVFYPPKFSDPETLLGSFKNVMNEISKFQEVETVKREVVNLQKKIEEVLSNISSSPTGLRGLTKDSSKKEIVVIFLAILHLFRNQLIHIEQTSHFEDINIVKR